MSNYKDDLTQDEQILHHHVARLKQNLEAYHACTDRDEETWTKVFSALLVFFLSHSSIKSKI